MVYISNYWDPIGKGDFYHTIEITIYCNLIEEIKAEYIVVTKFRREAWTINYLEKFIVY